MDGYADGVQSNKHLKIALQGPMRIFGAFKEQALSLPLLMFLFKLKVEPFCRWKIADRRGRLPENEPNVHHQEKAPAWRSKERERSRLLTPEPLIMIHAVAYTHSVCPERRR